ncbi:MAG: hypothetical protein IKE81_08190 [Clostridia bacterium]|nr:hypothetical protein [Clostridia bacterium]
MARRAISIDEQIDRQEAVVLAMKKKIDDMKVKYDAEVEKMAKLVEKKKSISRQEIIKLLDTTTRTDDEIKAFLRGENPDQEDE